MKYIELAKQAGWEYAHNDSGFEPLWAFAELVAAQEREACAKICDDGYFAFIAADIIRERGEA
jgi:hypothetical protein